MNSESDFIVYPVLSGEWRAYVKGNPNIQVWGFSEENAIKRLWDEIEKNHPELVKS
jgi:hypothetical protein